MSSPYCTLADLEQRFGAAEIRQLTDHAHDGATDAGVADRALSDAAAEIDGYLAARYTLPLGSVPTVLVRVCADIARYYLYDDAATEQVTQRYKDAIALLRRISTGEVSLGLSDDGELATTSDVAQMQSGGRVWGREPNGGHV